MVAPKLGPFVVFHPACFTCSACKELLGEISATCVWPYQDYVVTVDLTYCVYKDQVYCEYSANNFHVYFHVLLPLKTN